VIGKAKILYQNGIIPLWFPPSQKTKHKSRESNKTLDLLSGRCKTVLNINKPIGLLMDLEKIRQKEVKNLQQEISGKVVRSINLAGRGKEEWIRAILVKNDKSLSGKYTFITKDPVAVEYIPGSNKIDFLMSELLRITHKKELTASVYPDKSIKFS
jgi:hypothetical protein